MSIIVNLNGIPYLLPQTGETGWGQETTNYLVALGSGGLLTLEGGNFTLSNEVNFGPTYGVASSYFRSGLDPAASTGVVRLTNTEAVAWRNATDSGDLSLYLVGNQLYFAGNPVGGGTTSPLITKGDLYTFDTANARLPVGLNGQALVADSSASTGLSWQTVGGGGGGSVVGFSFTNANGVSGVVADPTTTPALTLTLGAITPTSVAASGTISGSNFSGTHSGASSGTNTGNQTIVLIGDVTGSGTGSFATTLAITVPIAKGGTGQTTANAGFNALAPSQATSAGKVLITDGSNTSWASFPGAGSVTSVSVVPLNGVTGSVSNPTTTPAISIGLGAITPTSVAASGTVTGSNISGTVSGSNTGDQIISLTGDVTGTGTGSFATTLANTAVVPGTYTHSTVTVDSKGRVTAVANGSLQTITLTGDVTGTGTGTFATVLAATGVGAGTYNTVTVSTKGLVLGGSNAAYITGNQAITVSGDATGSGTTSLALTLANTGVGAGTYNYATVTVDSKGRITGASSNTPVTSVSVVTANGVSGVVANSTTTPAITLTLGAITPTSVAAVGAITGSNLSGTSTGTNTGDQTIALTGDVTGSGTGSFAVTLANTAATPGSYTRANITVDSKGRITAASSGSSTFNTITLGGLGEAFVTSHSVDASLYNISKYTLSGNDTIPKPTNIPSGVAYTVTYFITQDGTSTVTWFTTIKWHNGTPTMSTGVGIADVYILTTFDTGTTWYGTPIQGYV